MLIPLRTLLLVLLAAATIPAWAADRASLSEVGSRPVANAGPALSARIRVAVTLDGSASHDAQSAARGGQGGPVAFAWALVQAPRGSAARVDAGLPAPEFVPDIPGVYAFELVVIGADGTRSAPARTTVTAFAANATPMPHIERLPSVHPGMPVELDGARSFDPEGTPLALAWWFETLPRASALTARDLFAVDGAHARFTPDVAGTYVVGLQASDGASSAETRVVVTARAGNLPPFARAEAATDGAAVFLDATESFDPDGPAPPAYGWTLVARPAGSASTQLDIQAASDARTRFVPDVEGDYVFRLDVFDGTAHDAENVLVPFTRTNVLHDADADAEKSAAALGAAERDANGRAAKKDRASRLKLNVAPRTLTVPAGGQGSVKVKLAGNPHGDIDASLDVTGLPSGVTAQFAQPMLAVGERTSLTLKIGASVSAGAYSLQVIATPQASGAVVTQTATIVLRVRSGGDVGGEEPVTCGPANLSALAQKVYVSPQGNDAAGCGATATGACATIQRGIDACGPSGCGVLVRYGRYRTTATINLRDRVDVYGGCVFAPVANPNYRTLIDASPAPGTPAISAASIHSPTLVSGIAVVGKEEIAAGMPSIAMAVTGTTGLTLARTMLAAGVGGNGAMGGTDAASAGGTGQQSFGSGGGAGGPSCAANHTSSAGDGGQGGDVLQYALKFPDFCFITCPCDYPNVNDSVGRTGLASSSVGGGGGGARAWGGDYCTGAASTADFVGKTGSAGSDGVCATQGGPASAQLFGLPNGQTGAWQPAAGGQGGSGSVGSGGGGGSGGGYCVGFPDGLHPEAVTGNPGSGGGGGGCGGNGGDGGQQGGASFALVLTGATVQGLGTGNSIVPGPGGAGGQGGTGGQGGAGGAGGNGLPAGPTNVGGYACPGPSGGGGTGGRGGAGGGGSGGNGGPSVGVLLLGGSTNPGTAGVYGGLPGQPGLHGSGGRNASVPNDPTPCTAPVGNNGLLGGFGLVVDPTRPPVNFMLPGDSLVQGQSRTSQDGTIELTLQTDGNFCLYKSGVFEWCSEQAGWGTADKVTMQTDGNLCLSTNGTNTRCSNTFPHSGAYLVVRDDGRVSIFDGTTSLWTIP